MHYFVTTEWQSERLWLKKNSSQNLWNNGRKLKIDCTCQIYKAKRVNFCKALQRETRAKIFQVFGSKKNKNEYVEISKKCVWIRLAWVSDVALKKTIKNSKLLS